MSVVSFFTPVFLVGSDSFDAIVINAAENYFFLGGEKVSFPYNGSAYGQITTESIPKVETVLKVISYCFIFFPVLRELPIVMGLIKLGYRSCFVFEEQSLLQIFFNKYFGLVP